MVGGAFLVPVVAATLIAFGLRGEPGPGRPEAEGTATQTVRPAATPEGEPTYGEYVPPEPEPQAGTKAPERAPAPEVTPRKRRTPKPSAPSRTRRACPPGWDDVWWLHRWCERHGHRGR